MTHRAAIRALPQKLLSFNMMDCNGGLEPTYRYDVERNVSLLLFFTADDRLICAILRRGCEDLEHIELNPPSKLPQSGRDNEKKPAYLEITIKLFIDPEKEIGPKSRVDVGGISEGSVREREPEFPSNVEVISLNRSAKTATLRIERKDEETMRRAVELGLLYLTPHRSEKVGKP
jgi:hypothetical protein